MDILRISTAALPPTQRVEAFREMFGRKILKFEVEPEPGASFEVDMTLQSLPGLGIGVGSLSPMRNSLTAELIDNDDLVLVILQEGSGTARQRGREETIGTGEAIVTNNGEPACFASHSQRGSPTFVSDERGLLRNWQTPTPACSGRYRETIKRCGC